MKFSQKYEFFEDSHGKNEILFAVTDNYTDLFSSEIRNYEVNIFDLGSVKVDSNDSDGAKIENELSLTINQIQIESANDQNCYDLCLTSINPTNKIHCAVFLNTTSVPNIEDALFIGILQPERDEDTLRWTSNEYDTQFNAIKKISQSAKPFFEDTFSSVSFTEIVNEIDEAWETANVTDRLSWIDAEQYGGSGYQFELKTYFADLVSLSKLLRKLADELEKTINEIDSSR